MPLFSIAGSQGSGKSTTLSNLPEFSSVTRKTSRSVLADWNVSLDEVNNDHNLLIKFQDEILHRKISDEQQYANSPNPCVTERTYADLFTYALIALGKDNQHSEWLNQYYDKCKQAQSTYSATFYLTAGHFAPVADGVRGTNVHYSRMADLTMYDCTQSMTAPTKLITINDPNLSNRVQIVRNYINHVHPLNAKCNSGI